MNLYTPINWTDIKRYHPDEQVKTESAIRVYKSSPDRVTMQVRGPERLKNGSHGKHGVIASAHLNAEELATVRDGINEALALLQ